MFFPLIWNRFFRSGLYFTPSSFLFLPPVYFCVCNMTLLFSFSSNPFLSCRVVAGSTPRPPLLVPFPPPPPVNKYSSIFVNAPVIANLFFFSPPTPVCLAENLRLSFFFSSLFAVYSYVAAHFWVLTLPAPVSPEGDFSPFVFPSALLQPAGIFFTNFPHHVVPFCWLVGCGRS